MRFYLDYNASAPMDDRVKSYVREIMDMYGNPSSVHTKGRKLKNILEISKCEQGNLSKFNGADTARRS